MPLSSRPRVLVISHSYINDENLKNMEALARRTPVRVVVPSRVKDKIFGVITSDHSAHPLRETYGRIDLPKNQYLLRTVDMGISKFGPDIIHIEYDPWTPMFWQAAALRRCLAPDARLFCTVKKNTYRRLPAALRLTKNFVARRLAQQVDHFFAVNEGVARLYRDMIFADPQCVSTLQHLGVDTDRFAPTRVRSAPVRVIGYCGRLEAEKGVFELINAVGALNAAGNDLELRMLGAGDLEAQLRRDAPPFVNLHGPVPHGRVADFLAEVDVFVAPARILPDHEEHDGHAVMEAMACGVTVVGSTSGVIPELLGNGRGAVFSAGDEQALARVLGRLIGDPVELAALSRAARSYAVEHFSIERIADRKFAAFSASQP